MSSSPSSAPPRATLSVDAVLAWSDDELVKYMLQKRGSDGGFHLDDVVGWDKISADKRNELAQRLRAGAAMVGESGQSLPVDLDQVAARLQSIANEDGDKKDDRPPSASAPARPKRRVGVPTPPEMKTDLPSLEEVQREENEQGKINETERYNDLVKEGGRPCYPISILQDVFEDPEKYRDMLRPLANTGLPHAWWRVFEVQWWTWENFRKWRQDMRGTYDAEAEYAKYLSKETHFHTVFGDDYWLEKLEGDPSESRRWFTDVEEWRRFEQRGLLEFPGEGFAAYSKAVEQRLAEHGFERSFRLEEDLARQDRLTTWIEYLNYEYCCHDRLLKLLELLQPKRDEAWKRLVDSGAVRPGETEEYLCSDESWFKTQDEIDRAQVAWKAAQAAGYAVLKRARRIPTSEERQRVMKAAQTRAEDAKARLKAVKERSNLITSFIKETDSHTNTKKKLARSAILLEWVLAQVPLIEAEMEEAEAGAGAAGGAPRATRGLGRDDDAAAAAVDVSDELTPKKQRSRRGGLQTDSLANLSSVTAVETEKGPKRRRDEGGDDEVVSDEPSPKKQRSRRGGLRTNPTANASPTAAAETEKRPKRGRDDGDVAVAVTDQPSPKKQRSRGGDLRTDSLAPASSLTAVETEEQPKRGRGRGEDDGGGGDDPGGAKKKRGSRRTNPTPSVPCPAQVSSPAKVSSPAAVEIGKKPKRGRDGVDDGDGADDEPSPKKHKSNGGRTKPPANVSSPAQVSSPIAVETVKKPRHGQGRGDDGGDEQPSPRKQGSGSRRTNPPADVPSSTQVSSPAAIETEKRPKRRRDRGADNDGASADLIPKKQRSLHSDQTNSLSNVSPASAVKTKEKSKRRLADQPASAERRIRSTAVNTPQSPLTETRGVRRSARRAAVR